ncbi:sensory neuron membrane protein 1-like isoform X2 [Armigeres subalbatus]|uniref:sensory neuron membrane protein 1-like isoform X2 n=2 Tax=Armigeres subalbatus TaxID=124917 RepID=UPI002ED61F77
MVTTLRIDRRAPVQSNDWVASFEHAPFVRTEDRGSARPTKFNQNVLLKPGTQMRGMFEELPFPLDFKLYLFDVINPDEVMKGGKPHVREIGPYYFEEWKVKYDTEDNIEDDTLTFTLRNTWIFRPDVSAPLTGDEIITLPHPLVLGALLMVQRDREAMMPLVSKGMNIIMDPLTTGFLTTRVMDLLFDGILIDCSSHEFSAKALCSGLESEGAVSPYNETHFMFSLFGMRNATDAGRWSVYRGVKNIKDLGRVVTYNGETEMDMYDGDECNKFVGTDSTIFPPFLTTKDKLWAWSPEICRSMGAYYFGKSKYAGLPMSFFKLDFGDLKNEPEHHCFCRDPPDDCPPKGTMDLSPCLGAPFIGSKPHFYDADPALLAAVDGLTPNEKDHDMYIHFELLSGTPVSAAKRLQFSMELEPVRDHPVLGNLPNVILPLFWAEEGASLNKTWTNQLKYQLFLGLKFNATVKWLTIIIGTVGTIAAMFMHFKRGNKMGNVTPVEAVTNGSAKGSGSGGMGANNRNGSPTRPVVPTTKDLVIVNNGRNLPNVIDGLEKPHKVVLTEMSQERY